MSKTSPIKPRAARRARTSAPRQPKAPTIADIAAQLKTRLKPEEGDLNKQLAGFARTLVHCWFENERYREVGDILKAIEKHVKSLAAANPAGFLVPFGDDQKAIVGAKYIIEEINRRNQIRNVPEEVKRARVVRAWRALSGGPASPGATPSREKFAAWCIEFDQPDPSFAAMVEALVLNGYFKDDPEIRNAAAVQRTKRARRNASVDYITDPKAAVSAWGKPFAKHRKWIERRTQSAKAKRV